MTARKPRLKARGARGAALGLALLLPTLLAPLGPAPRTPPGEAARAINPIGPALTPAPAPPAAPETPPGRPAPPASPPADPAPEPAQPFSRLASSRALAYDGAGFLYVLADGTDTYSVLRETAAGSGRFAPLYHRAKQTRPNASVPGPLDAPPPKSSHSRAGYSETPTALTVDREGALFLASTLGLWRIDPAGRVARFTLPHFDNTLALAAAAHGGVYALRATDRSTSDPTHRGAGLELYYLPASFDTAQRLVKFPVEVEGFAGNSLAEDGAGNILLVAYESGAYRLYQVRPDGSWIRWGDFYRLTGALAADRQGNVYATGLARPRSNYERDFPLPLVLAFRAGTAPKAVATLARPPRYEAALPVMALGPHGQLVTGQRWQVTSEQWEASLQRLDLGAAAAGPPSGQAVAYSLPFVRQVVVPALAEAGYAGPAIARPGDTLALVGSNFGTSRGEGAVTIGGRPATILSWSEDRIMVEVPANAPPDQQPVSVHRREAASEALPLLVKSPGTMGVLQAWDPLLPQALEQGLVQRVEGLVVVEGRTAHGAIFRTAGQLGPDGRFVLRIPDGTYEVRATGTCWLPGGASPFQRAGSFTLTSEQAVVLWAYSAL